jgi:hypothetical protein
MQRDAMLVLRLPKALKDALGTAAEDNLRSMSSMAVWAMTEWLRSNGYDATGTQQVRTIREKKARGAGKTRGKKAQP